MALAIVFRPVQSQGPVQGEILLLPAERPERRHGGLALVVLKEGAGCLLRGPGTVDTIVVPDDPVSVMVLMVVPDTVKFAPPTFSDIPFVGAQVKLRL